MNSGFGPAQTARFNCFLDEGLLFKRQVYLHITKIGRDLAGVSNPVRHFGLSKP
jgi:hypothetical protein